MPQLVTYNDARVLAQIDNTNALASYAQLALLPNQGSGNALTEVVHNVTDTNVDIATQGDITWNADGSISYLSTPNGGTYTNTTGFLTNTSAPISVIPYTDDIILFTEIARAYTSNSNNYPNFIKVNLSWASTFYIEKHGYDTNTIWVGARVGGTYYRQAVTIGNVFPRTTITAHFKSATAEIDVYVNGAFSFTITATPFASNITFTEYQLAGMDAGCSFYSGYALAKTGSFTTAEINEIVTNPYQIFKVAVGSGITGSITQTTSSFTQTLLGSIGFNGSVNQTISSFTQSLSGSLGFTGNTTQTTQSFTQSANGSVFINISGTISQTINAFTQSSTGLVITPITGIINQQINSFTQSATGNTPATWIDKPIVSTNWSTQSTTSTAWTDKTKASTIWS